MRFFALPGAIIAVQNNLHGKNGRLVSTPKHLEGADGKALTVLSSNQVVALQSRAVGNEGIPDTPRTLRLTYRRRRPSLLVTGRCKLTYFVGWPQNLVQRNWT